MFEEPVGHVKPRVSSKTIEIKEVRVNDTFVGLCPGQAYPVPVYRFVITFNVEYFYPKLRHIMGLSKYLDPSFLRHADN